MQSTFDKLDIKTKLPYKSDWFLKKDRIKELERENNKEKLYLFIKAFKKKWKLK